MDRNSKLSLSLTSLMLPAAILVGTLTGLILKSQNSANVDITADLAYLRPIMVSVFVTLAVFGLGALIAGVRGLKSADRSLAKLSLVLLAVIAVMATATLGLQKQTENIEDDYAARKTQTFFQELKEN